MCLRVSYGLVLPMASAGVGKGKSHHSRAWLATATRSALLDWFGMGTGIWRTMVSAGHLNTPASSHIANCFEVNSAVTSCHHTFLLSHHTATTTPPPPSHPTMMRCDAFHPAMGFFHWGYSIPYLSNTCHATTPPLQTGKSRRRRMKGSPARRLAAMLAAATTMTTPVAAGGAAAGAAGSGALSRPR